MTQFGKFLVCVNFMFALLFLTWSTAVYTQRIDWKERLETLEEKINTRSADRDASQARWAAELPLLPAAEKERADYLAWYPEQLQILRTGKDKAGKVVEPVVRRLVRRPDGLLLEINDKKPENVISIIVANDAGAQPVEKIENLRSYDDYEAEWKKLREEVKVNQKQIQELVDQNKMLTEEIAGVFDDKDKTKLIKKGLRAQLADEQSYAQLFLDEMGALKPQLGARLIETDALKRRVEQLSARLKQLQDPGVAVRP
jgi:hypothetical protein